MTVTVRLFAMLRERAGADRLELELPEGARVADVLERLAALADGLPLVLAVNREYASEDQLLAPGDELALIPPVSGGAGLRGDGGVGSEGGGRGQDEVRVEGGDRSGARVTGEPLSLEDLRARVRDPRAGAVVTFEGVTRAVESLEYEAYEEMARERITAIVDEAIARHGLCAAACEHRVGSVPLSEPSVAVAVSAPHRGEAFAGAREIIDRVKDEVPIWKREVDGGVGRWVDGKRP